jgi:hypothetical protein
MRRAISVFVILGFALALSAGTAFAVSTVDQRQVSPPDSYVGTSFDHPLAQTFVAGRSGLLDRVSFDVFLRQRPGVTEPALVVQLQSTDRSGDPSNTALASTQVPPARFTAGQTFETVAFQDPVRVSAGRRYAIVVFPRSDPPEAGVEKIYFWRFTSVADGPDAYPAGRMSIGHEATGAWDPMGVGNDFRFKTFVDSNVAAG